MNLRAFYWWLVGELGIDVRRLLEAIAGTPRMFRDYLEFRREFAGKLELRPCLHDWHEHGGVARGEYFVQDLYVARCIFKAVPKRHVDIGSRIDGFVSHVASFRELEVFDIRPISSPLGGMVFRRVDLTKASDIPRDYCDSVSCLHALEHFGLGRYGDPINVEGHLEGLRNMAALLQPRGVLYLSTPVGRERVVFNAHRVIDPRLLVDFAAALGLRLNAIAVLDRTSALHQTEPTRAVLEELARSDYSLGIFTFEKACGSSVARAE